MYFPLFIPNTIVMDRRGAVSAGPIDYSGMSGPELYNFLEREYQRVTEEIDTLFQRLGQFVDSRGQPNITTRGTILGDRPVPVPEITEDPLDNEMTRGAAGARNLQDSRTPGAYNLWGDSGVVIPGLQSPPNIWHNTNRNATPLNELNTPLMSHQTQQDGERLVVR